MIRNELIKISEVAKFLGVSTKPLRYYEQYGFIKPAKIDSATGYRYYNIKNNGEITHIIDMGRSGLSMRQIKNYFQSGFDVHFFINDLKKKRAALDKQIKIIDLRLIINETYTIDYIKTKPTFCLKRVIVARDIQDIENQFASFLLENLKKGYMLDSNFVTLIEFDSVVPQFENLNIKMLIMVKEPTIECELYPAVYGIHTYHRGNYESIGNAYEALLIFAKQHNLTLKGTAIENYFRSSFAVSDENSMLTDVILPLKD